MENRAFKILAIDGGGIRGVFPAHILLCIEKRLDMKVARQFDLIAGTSTGAIVAAAVACDIDIERVISFYKEYGRSIFKRRIYWGPKWTEPGFRSRYDVHNLSVALNKLFADIQLGDINVPLILPATDIGNGNVYVFKSGYSKDFSRDRNVLLREAILASCSAPTYFDPHKADSYLLADGGLWANNPSLVAVIDAKRRLDIEINNIKILSIGTGHSKTCYGLKPKSRWGLITGWKGTSFIDLLMSLQAESTNNYLQLLLKNKQMVRLGFESDCPLPMDDYSAIDTLISKADQTFTYNSSKIRDILST